MTIDALGCVKSPPIPNFDKKYDIEGMFTYIGAGLLCVTRSTATGNARSLCEQDEQQ